MFMRNMKVAHRCKNCVKFKPIFLLGQVSFLAGSGNTYLKSMGWSLLVDTYLTPIKKFFFPENFKLKAILVDMKCMI